MAGPWLFWDWEAQNRERPRPRGQQTVLTRTPPAQTILTPWPQMTQSGPVNSGQAGGGRGAGSRGTDTIYLQPLRSDPGTVSGPPTVKKPRLMLSFTAGDWRHQTITIIGNIHKKHSKKTDTFKRYFSPETITIKNNTGIKHKLSQPRGDRRINIRV